MHFCRVRVSGHSLPAIRGTRCLHLFSFVLVHPSSGSRCFMRFRFLSSRIYTYLHICVGLALWGAESVHFAMSERVVTLPAIRRPGCFVGTTRFANESCGKKQSLQTRLMGTTRSMQFLQCGDNKGCKQDLSDEATHCKFTSYGSMCFTGFGACVLRKHFFIQVTNV